MADKRITDVDFIESLNSDESFFINRNNTIKQIRKTNVVFNINNGGTGATDADAARNNLGAASKVHEHTTDDIVSGILPISRGGTGASDADAARNNLGAAAKVHEHTWDSLSNKPFYEEIVTTKYFDINTEIGADTCTYNDLGSLDLNNYVVIFDGIRYEVEKGQYSHPTPDVTIEGYQGTFYYLGNKSLDTTDNYEDTGEPFLIRVINANSFIAGSQAHLLINFVDSSVVHSISLISEKEVVTKIEEKYIPSSVVKVWRNKFPESAFDGQTIDLSFLNFEFDGVSILYKNETSGTLFLSTGYIPKGYKSRLSYLSQSSGKRSQRIFTVSDNEIAFEAGEYSDGNSSNIHCIPVEIYAVKNVASMAI